MNRTYKSIAEIKRANDVAGNYFFSPDTMRFFRSIVHPGVYGGRFFITSEQFVASDGEEFPREYTIREAHDDGSVTTVDLPKSKSRHEAFVRLELYITNVDVVH